MAAVFIAQTTLQEWADLGRVRLDDNVLILLKEQRQVRLKPAVRFTQVLGADADPHQLLGKVKSREQLDALQAEHYMDSVLLGEIAYQVVEGFLGDLLAAEPIGAAPAPASDDASPKEAPQPVSGLPSPSDESPEDDDAEALSRLFLETVH